MFVLFKEKNQQEFTLNCVNYVSNTFLKCNFWTNHVFNFKIFGGTVILLKHKKLFQTKKLKQRVKYVFYPSSCNEIWNWSIFKIFDQFSPSFLEMYGFSHFNQMLWSLSNISSAFHNSIWIIYIVWPIFI